MVFQPGQSGNPDKIFKPGNSGGPGRPRKGFITDEAAEFLMEEHPKQPGKTRKRVLAEQWVRRAGREQRAMDSLIDRLEGKPTDMQEIAVTNATSDTPLLVLPAGRAGLPGQSDPSAPGTTGGAAT